MRQFHKVKYNVGDEVYWNDPDRGICSGWYTVTKIIDRDTLVLDYGTEVFIWEIRNETIPKEWSQ
jgi:hypothetical protein